MLLCARDRASWNRLRGKRARLTSNSYAADALKWWEYKYRRIVQCFIYMSRVILLKETNKKMIVFQILFAKIRPVVSSKRMWNFLRISRPVPIVTIQEHPFEEELMKNCLNFEQKYILTTERNEVRFSRIFVFNDL